MNPCVRLSPFLGLDNDAVLEVVKDRHIADDHQIVPEEPVHHAIALVIVGDGLLDALVARGVGTEEPHGLVTQVLGCVFTGQILVCTRATGHVLAVGLGHPGRFAIEGEAHRLRHAPAGVLARTARTRTFLVLLDSSDGKCREQERHYYQDTGSFSYDSMRT